MMVVNNPLITPYFLGGYPKIPMKYHEIIHFVLFILQWQWSVQKRLPDNMFNAFGRISGVLVSSLGSSESLIKALKFSELLTGVVKRNTSSKTFFGDLGMVYPLDPCYIYLYSIQINCM